jgi:DNA primase
MYIPEEKISEILNASDIVDIVSESVILKKSGRNFFGLCPFHSEKTPSFSVNAAKQIFHCFGCSAGGNVISFVMKYHGMSFPEAAKMLARKYQITIETENIDPAAQKAIKLKEDLFRLNKSVMEYFVKALVSSKGAMEARAYLKRRQFSDEIISEFKLGFSYDSWDSVVNLIRQQKVSRQTALQSGLVLERKQKNGFYDRFRNRVMFPIFDINMQVAGFGGRVMNDDMPKYMNSPETPVYSKSRILYGLHAAKQYCRQEGFVYIVEGYFDFLSLYQAGIKNTVATLGTALTTTHVRILKGYAANMVLVFDSDAAGISAAKRSIELFLKEGVDTRILVLPQGNDPDSFVMKNGKEAFLKQAENASSVMQFLLQVAIDTHGLSIEGRVHVLNDMKPYLSMVTDSALRSLYVKELSETLQIDENAVLEKVRQQFIQQKSTGMPMADNSLEDDGNRPDPREEQIVSMMLNFPQIIPEVIRLKAVDYFYSKALKRVAQCILKVSPDKDAFITHVMAQLKTDGDRELIASLAMAQSQVETDIKRMAGSIISRFIRVRKKQENVLTNKIISAEKGGDSEIMELLMQKQNEIRQLHNQ